MGMKNVNDAAVILIHCCRCHLLSVVDDTYMNKQQTKKTNITFKWTST